MRFFVNRQLFYYPAYSGPHIATNIAIAIVIGLTDISKIKRRVAAADQ